MGSREGLRWQTARVVNHQQSWPAVAAPRLLRVGDLLMMTASDLRPDFWLVAENASDSGDRLQLVPADIDPICGSGDVALPDDGATGALTVRCGFAVWLEAESVRPLARAGSVDACSLELIRARLAALDAAEPIGTAPDRDTEAELEYRDLVAELTEARDRLLAKAGRSNSEVPVSRPKTEVVPARRFAGSLALAASLLLSLSLGLVAGWIGRGSGTESQTPAVTPDGPLAGVPFEWLSPRVKIRNQTRDSITEISPADTPYVALFLDVGVSGEGGEYRLDIRRQGAADIWWSGSARRTGTAEIFILLPTAGLEAGDYALELSSVADPEMRVSYDLRITAAGQPP